MMIVKTNQATKRIGMILKKNISRCKINGFMLLLVPAACKTRSAKGITSMSEKNPECPLYNPLNCKEYYNPKLCAFVRKDKTCRKKKKPKNKNSSDSQE